MFEGNSAEGVVVGFQLLRGLGEMFEGDSADMCAGKFLLVSMGGRGEGLGYADPVARTIVLILNFVC